MRRGGRVGLVGRVGFEQQVLEGHGRGERAQATGAFVGHRAAEPKEKTFAPERLGLLAAARETVHDAAEPAHPPDRRDHGVHGVARVDDHRQVEVPRELQLRVKQCALAVRIQPVHEIVEPAFPTAIGASRPIHSRSRATSSSRCVSRYTGCSP